MSLINNNKLLYNINHVCRWLCKYMQGNNQLSYLSKTTEKHYTEKQNNDLQVALIVVIKQINSTYICKNSTHTQHAGEETPPKLWCQQKVKYCKFITAFLYSGQNKQKKRNLTQKKTSLVTCIITLMVKNNCTHMCTQDHIP